MYLVESINETLSRCVIVMEGLLRRAIGGFITLSNFLDLLIVLHRECVGVAAKSKSPRERDDKDTQ